MNLIIIEEVRTNEGGTERSIGAADCKENRKYLNTTKWIHLLTTISRILATVQFRRKNAVCHHVRTRRRYFRLQKGRMNMSNPASCSGLLEMFLNRLQSVQVLGCCSKGKFVFQSHYSLKVDI